MPLVFSALAVGRRMTVFWRWRILTSDKRRSAPASEQFSHKPVFEEKSVWGLEGMYCKFLDQFIEGIDACTEAAGQACRVAFMDHGTDYARHGLRIELQRSGTRSRLIAILLACAAM